MAPALQMSRGWVLGLLLLRASALPSGPNELRTTAPRGCASLGGRSVSAAVVACPGRWDGHIREAHGLCGPAFHLCTEADAGGALSGLSWAMSEGLPGCFAYNAAQDGDRCLPCIDDIASDDLAAVGRDCPHRNYGPGRATCLGEGRVDASCCTDSLRASACHHRVGITTGVLCCRNPVVEAPPPAASPVQAVRQSGERVRVQCPVAADLQRAVEWRKGGRRLHHRHGDFTLPFSGPSDSGLYSCRQGSETGFFNLTVQAVATYACSDGTSEGFHDAHNVRGCAGKWKGHIRRGGRELCGAGWRVCGRKEAAFLGQIRPEYLRDFGGCFAFNAAQSRSKCKRCKSGLPMAGLGSACGVNRKALGTEEGCVPHRWVAALSPKATAPVGPACHHEPSISGLLCCRRWSRKERAMQAARAPAHLHRHSARPGFQRDDLAEATCYPSCRNGGTCLRDGRCLCPVGFKGETCQHGGCSERCENGGECILGACKCEPPFYGHICHHSHRVWLNQSGPAAPPRLQSRPEVEFNEIPLSKL